MILFADTSALVKLYLGEVGSRRMMELASGSIIVVSPLAYAEAHATFARLRREGILTIQTLELVIESFERDWATMVRTPFSPEMLLFVPELCAQHPLRGADAVQLASALLLRREGADLTFATSDRRLLEAARGEGLGVIDPAATT